MRVADVIYDQKQGSAIDHCAIINKEKAKKVPSVKKNRNKKSDVEDAIIEMSEDRTVFLRLSIVLVREIRERNHQLLLSKQEIWQCLFFHQSRHFIKKSTVAGIPSGKTNKELSCDLDHFICLPEIYRGWAFCFYLFFISFQ